MAAVDWVSTHEDVMPSFTHRQFLPVGPITSLFTRAVGFMCEATHGSPVVVNRKVSESGTDRMCDCIGIFSDAVLLRFIFFAEGYKSDAIGTMSTVMQRHNCLTLEAIFLMKDPSRRCRFGAVNRENFKQARLQADFLEGNPLIRWR